MKNTKRVFSLILCLSMVCSLLVAGTVSANAEAPTRIINDFDTAGQWSFSGGNHSGLGWQTKYDGATIKEIDYTTIDENYAYGEVLKLNGGASNYGGFKIDTSWAYGSPIALKFQVWTNAEGKVLGSRTGISEATTEQTAFSGKSLGAWSGDSIVVPNTPTEYTYDLTKIGFSGSNLTLVWNPSSNFDFYVDNITLVYAEGTEAPANVKSWETMYDWEDAAQMNSISYQASGSDKQTVTRGTAGAWSNIGSTYGLKVIANYNNYNSTTKTVQNWFSVPATELMKNALSLRVATYQAFANGSGQYYGVEIGGKVYWSGLSGISSDVFCWYYYDYRTFYLDPKDNTSDSVYLTRDNLNQITALYFSFHDSYSIRCVDDIQVGTTNTATATFPGTDLPNITSDDSGKITLPKATSDKFVGWLGSDAKLYKAGAAVSLTKSTSFQAVEMTVAQQVGAGIRWASSEAERGIRFETYVTKAAFDALGSNSIEFGALILPYSKYDANITVDNAEDYKAVNVVDPDVYGTTSNGANYRYYSGVVDFEKYFNVKKSALADLKVTCVSYVKVYYHNGTSACFYDHPDEIDNVRTVAEVARAALADTEFPYSDNQKAILELYTEYSKETTVPQYRNDAKDNVDQTEEVAFTFIGDITDKSGSGFNSANHDNGAAINGYTPTGSVAHYVNTGFSVGNKLTFTLPEDIAYGKYKISFYTRGYTGRASAKVEVSSEVGSAVAADNQSFIATTTSAPNYWYNVACPNTVEIKGKTTITMTSTVAGSLYLYSVVLTPAE